MWTVFWTFFTPIPPFTKYGLSSNIGHLANPPPPFHVHMVYE